MSRVEFGIRDRIVEKKLHFSIFLMYVYIYTLWIIIMTISFMLNLGGKKVW